VREQYIAQARVVFSSKISVSIKNKKTDLHERNKITSFGHLGIAVSSEGVALPSIRGVQNTVWVCASTACLGSKPDEQEDECNKCARDRFFHAKHSWWPKLFAILADGPEGATLAWHFPQNAHGDRREQAAKDRTA
jgi:hypothetical protein